MNTLITVQLFRLQKPWLRTVVARTVCCDRPRSDLLLQKLFGGTSSLIPSVTRLLAPATSFFSLHATCSPRAPIYTPASHSPPRLSPCFAVTRPAPAATATTMSKTMPVAHDMLISSEVSTAELVGDPPLSPEPLSTPRADAEQDGAASAVAEALAITRMYCSPDDLLDGPRLPELPPPSCVRKRTRAPSCASPPELPAQQQQKHCESSVPLPKSPARAPLQPQQPSSPQPICSPSSSSLGAAPGASAAAADRPPSPMLHSAASWITASATVSPAHIAVDKVAASPP